ncbi:MAG: bifunctional 5,10-methylenetetrahydrofolate dehydrogenase/5,10-methenyltetrahydrofolate cyclohydrolase, partial [Vampirovibrionales bacterium]|nr:bifunctional 5,10-methylenetetrahydrofolate dehydrogenase/5,10-methenyltetrahydrofolate cyclohydrolase [Vampirovibrionales bacterium]
MTLSSTALRLDGKLCADALLETLKTTVADLAQNGKRIPQLVVIQVGADPASSVYVKKKKQTAEGIGMRSEIISLADDVAQSVLLDTIQRLNDDEAVDGILVQLPLPKHLDESAVLESISPTKDVDGFHPFNVGRLGAGLSPYALPCTPAGMMNLLDFYKIEIAGKHAVIVGRSNIVGKPMAQLLLKAHATVTICHSRTKNIEDFLKQADILVLAVGMPQAFKGEQLKKGAVVLDVGINRLPNGKLVGDADYA